MLVEVGWLALAFILGSLASRVQLPAMVGFIIAGVSLGLAGAEPTALLAGTAHAGVLLLLFGVGLHLRLRMLLNRVALVGGGLHLVISTALFAIVTTSLGLNVSTALFLGLILAFSSTVLAAKDLESREELGAYYGRLSIAILLLQDTVALCLILVVGGQAPSPWALGLFLLPLLRPLLVRVVRLTRDDDLLLVLAAILALGAGALFEHAGLPSEIGALLCGALLADHERAADMQDRLWGLKELLLVGFFLQVGMMAIPASASYTALLGWVALTLIVLPFKAALFFGLLSALGLRARTAFLTGSTLTSYSEFTLMAGLVGVREGLLTADMFSVLTLVTVASFAINLPLNRLVNGLYERWEDTLLRFQRDATEPDRPLRTIGRATHIVVGMGRTGTAAFDHLHSIGGRPIGLEVDPVVIQRQLAAGRRVAFGDALDPELWDALDLDEVQGVVLAVPNFTARVRGVAKIRAAHPDLPVTTYALSDRELPELLAAGAKVLHILSDAGVHLAESLRR